MRQFPLGAVIIAEPAFDPDSDDADRDGRLTERRRTLSPETERQIAALAGRKSLRSLAADFGVSHETIRSIIKRRAA